MPRPDTTDAKKTTHFGYLTIPEKEKVEWVRRHFNSVAHKYDYMNTLLSLGIHYQWKRMAVKSMRLRSGDHVLDVCGGTGDLSRMAAEQVAPSGRVVLYDINWEMMAAGRPKTQVSPHHGLISFVQGDAEAVTFPDNCFDAVMVSFGIRNLTHFEEGFRQMYRVLKRVAFMCLEFSEPVAPWFRQLYDFYSFYIMPCVGRL